MYKNILLFLLSLLLIKTLGSKEIIINVTGLAKVGKECFLNVEVQDKSDLLIQNLDLLIYSLDKDNRLIGKSYLHFFDLRKKQPYKTFSPVEMNFIDSCKKIKKVDLIIEDCSIIEKNDSKPCIHALKIADNNFDNYLEVNISNNRNYYLERLNKDYFIPELDIRLQALDLATAKRYKIKNYKNGLVVLNKNNSLFKEGDLIIEAEMNSIFKVKDLSEKIQVVKNNKKKSILISLVRAQREKFVAVVLK